MTDLALRYRLLAWVDGAVLHESLKWKLSLPLSVYLNSGRSKCVTSSGQTELARRELYLFEAGDVENVDQVMQ